MKRYAKIINGELSYSPNKLVVGDTVVYNPSEVLLRSNGYKELISAQVPQIQWNENLATTYTEVNDKIVAEYKVVKREVSDDEIDDLRQKAYVVDSDPHLSAYLYYKEIGDTVKAQEAFVLVEQAKSSIKVRYPKASD